MKLIKTEVFYVLFNFGSTAYVGVNIYEGKTLNECIKLRSKDIVSYVSGDKWIDVE